MRRWFSVVVGLGLLSCVTRGAEPEQGAQPPPVPDERIAARAFEANPGSAGSRVMLLPPGRVPVSVSVEVVSRPAERRQGLMYRRKLDADAGMLFVFERAQQQTFWMHNTYIPLDMIFIRADLAVLGVVENAEPLTDDPRQVPGRSQYVLEVNAGFARSHGVGPGTKVRFLNIPP